MSRRVVSRYRESVAWTLLVLVSISVSVSRANVTHALNNTSEISTRVPASKAPTAPEVSTTPATSVTPAVSTTSAVPVASTVLAAPTVPAIINESSREVNKKPSPLGESLQLVANQLSDTLLHTHNAHANRHDLDETSHAGIAVPISLDELDTESTSLPAPAPTIAETSTGKKGISTWILLSNPSAANTTNAFSITTTEPSKFEEPQKKKTTISKNKPKRPQPSKPSSKRPLIASINKSDLVAGGSAINDNQLNKLKDTVLSNVHKNKNTSTQKTTTSFTTTTAATITETNTKKDDMMKNSTSSLPVVKVTSKPSKKNNKIKQKVTTTTTTEEPVMNESALLPMEAKEQEIELEISTPATTTKKSKHTSSKKKKNKTKKRKTTAVKNDEAATTAVKTTEVKKPSKTKTKKPTKNPDNPITTQIFSYLSREVMPSVGVGVIGLAGLVGLASYFLYPFATPVRRTFELDKKDDLYRHNAEEYASEGNGQPEEEMLGTVLAGMPAHSKHALNPYIGQMAQSNPQRYAQKKEQDLKYRQVASGYEAPNYNVHYPQQKTGIAHGAVYSEPTSYGAPQYENRHKYSTQNKYSYDNSAYTPYATPTAAAAASSAVEPIYAAPQIGPSGAAQFNNEVTNSVVYGVKPAAETDFKPVYPFEGQVFSETTSNPMTFPSTSMYLGSNSEADPDQTNYSEEDVNDEAIDNKFVVGNVPKELADSATPAIVPEHGPRKLNRKKRNAALRKRSIIDRIEEILRAVKAAHRDIEMSNEIDGSFEDKMIPLKIGLMDSPVAIEIVTEGPLEKETETEATTVPVYVYANRIINATSNVDSTATSIYPNELIENVSTFPLEEAKKEENADNTVRQNNVDYTTVIYATDGIYLETSTTNKENRSHNTDFIRENNSRTTISNKFNEIDTTQSNEIYKGFSELNKNTESSAGKIETTSNFLQSTPAISLSQESNVVNTETLNRELTDTTNNFEDSKSTIKEFNKNGQAVVIVSSSSRTPLEPSLWIPLRSTSKNSQPSQTASTSMSSKPSTQADISTSSQISTTAGTSMSSEPSTPVNMSTNSQPSTTVKTSKNSQPSTSAGTSTSSKPSTSENMSTNSQPSTSAGTSTSSKPSTPENMSTNSQPRTTTGTSKSSQSSTTVNTSTNSQPRTTIGTSKSSQPSTPSATSTSSQPSTTVNTSTNSQPSAPANISTSSQPSTPVSTATTAHPKTFTHTPAITSTSTSGNTSASSSAKTSASNSTSTRATSPSSTRATTVSPPVDAGSTFLRLVRQLIEAKFQLGLNLLRTTSESLNRYLDKVHGSLPSGTYTVTQSKPIT